MDQHIVTCLLDTVNARIPYDFPLGCDLAEAFLLPLNPAKGTFSTYITNGIYTNYPHQGIVDAMFEISFQRLLSNEDASQHYLGYGKRMCGATLLPWPLSYSPDVMTRRLRTRKDLLSIMERSSSPFSLLCEQVTTHLDAKAWKLLKRKPLLFVPGVTRQAWITIGRWEEENITTARENFFGAIRISKRSYDTHISSAEHYSVSTHDSFSTGEREKHL